jgi:hypothetical protein
VNDAMAHTQILHMHISQKGQKICHLFQLMRERREEICSRNRLLVIAAVALFNCLGITYLDLPKYFSLVAWRGGRVLVSYRLAKVSCSGICSLITFGGVGQAGLLTESHSPADQCRDVLLHTMNFVSAT